MYITYPILLLLTCPNQLLLLIASLILLIESHDNISYTRAVPSGNQATPITLANTRQIGCRRTIELTKGAGGLGIGLTSRDVLTDNKSHPVYIKSIHPGGAAFQDGKLKLGDRLLSINGIDIQVHYIIMYMQL